MTSPAKYVIVGLLFAYSSLLSAQEHSFKKIFDTNYWVTDMAMDKSNSVWITTLGGEGLYHYTGNEFEKAAFKEYGNTDSVNIASTALTSLAIDERDNLWIGTYGYGLEYYDVTTNEFSHFRYDSLVASSIANDTITDILIDQQKNLWVGTYRGLSVRWSNTKSFETLLGSESIYSLHEDVNGDIWISLGVKFSSNFDNTGGLRKFRADSSTIETVTLGSMETGFGHVFTDEQQAYVSVENRGVFNMASQNNAFVENCSCKYTRLVESSPFQKSDFISSFLFKDVNNSLWIGSFGGGVDVYNFTLDSVVQHYGPHFDFEGDLVQDTTSNLKAPATSYIYEPELGLFWVGTIHGIYSVSETNKLQIPFYPLPYYEANSMFLLRNILFIATSDYGLVQKNISNGEVRTWNSYPNADFTIPGLQTSWSIRIDQLTQTIWLSSTGQGLYKIEYLVAPDYPFYTPSRVRNFVHEPDDPQSIISNVINGMTIDRTGLIWLATNGGLSSFDPIKETASNYVIQSSGSMPQTDSTFYCVEQAFDGSIWAGSERGIHLLNKQAGTFQNYPIGFVGDISVDHKGNVWAGSRSGLYYYDRQTKDFIRLTKEDIGIELRNVIGMIEDWENNLWVTTKNELIRINEERTSVLVFGEEQGVTYNQMGWQDNHMTYDEELFIGHHGGYYYFDPKRFEDAEIPPPTLNFSTLRIGNEVVRPGEGILIDALNQTSQIELNHDQNTFSIEFTGADYYFTQPLDFRFKLEGYNTEWNDLGSDNRVFFFQVPPDDYTLRIVAANEAGLVTTKELAISIGKPWWRKLWAYLMYLFILGFSIWTVHKIQRTRTLRKERERVKDKRLQEALEIEQAYKKLSETQEQLIHSEKMASLGELTAGIAHEIQNPLNFVNNFSELNKELLEEQIEELSKGDLKEARSIAKDIIENEEKINHHGKRAEEIVKSMLQHSRGGEGEKELTDINLLADEYLRLAYHGLRAKDKSFNAEFECSLDENLPKIEVVPQDIGRVLLNLINNAFQAVSEKAKALDNGFVPKVEVITYLNQTNLEMIVKDNGPGIPAEIKEKIFQPFFTTKPTGEGTGLGLSMSFDIITKGHNGTIEVYSEMGQGSQFLINLPLD